MTTSRMTATLTDRGRIALAEQPVPELRPGHVLIEVHRSLISPGSELGGWHALSAQRSNGNGATPHPPKPFGYSNAGVVLETGEGVTQLAPGDRVAAIGVNYALHTTHAVVPHHLCVKLPANVDFEEGAYGMLLATAMQGLRRADPRLGEYVCVVGLGLLGQLAARLFQLSGCYVIGWESLPQRCAIARGFGIPDVVRSDAEDAVPRTLAFTVGHGLDFSVFAFGGNGEEVFDKTLLSLKRSPDGHPTGAIIVLGHAQFPFKTKPMHNVDIRMASRTGPGYHDKAWESGADYPLVYVRWTTHSNLELAIRLIAEGRINVRQLTTHRIPFANAETEIDRILDAPDEILGVVFEMKDPTTGTARHA
ncbi:MAG: hypothetical protein PWP23_1140 [Candidatus Sumerlaeota bacterium]|nr:hypothetical protein [Candidatus Sumerlaeota bacterium]